MRACVWTWKECEVGEWRSLSESWQHTMLPRHFEMTPHGVQNTLEISNYPQNNTENTYTQHSITATWRYPEASVTAKTLLDTVFLLNLIVWYCVKLRLLRKIKEWTIRFDAMYQHIPQASVKMSFIFQVEGNATASTSLEELILFSKSLSCHFVRAFVAATF